MYSKILILKLNNMKKVLFFILNILLIFCISCAVNPVTGKRELILISKAQENKIGAKSDKEIIKQYGTYYDEKVVNYVESMGYKLVKYVHRHDVKYHFRVLDSTQVNAFAVPGGYVYITRGLLAYLNNEAQLAAVLGHELGHINARHMAKQMTNSILANLGLSIGMIAVPELKNFSDLISKGVQLLFLKFSRDDEYQADYLGILYSMKAGYDAHEMAKFFKTLERIEKKEHNTLPEFLSTHPSPPHRIENVQVDISKVIDKIGYKKLKINKFHYLSHIEGLIFGNDPRQGFVEKGYFYHPVLKFKFRSPDSFKVYNFPSEVVLVSKRRDSIIFFHFAKGDNLKDAVRIYLNRKDLTTYYEKSIYVNGYRAIKIGSVDKKKNYAVISYFIEMNGKIYQFDCLYRDFNERYSYIPYSFSLLLDKEKLNRKPKRIHIVKVKRKTRLKKFLYQLGIRKRKLINQIAIINGYYEYDLLKPGDYIKIIK